MPELSSKESTARKQHDCWWCAEPILKGQRYARWTWAEDGVLSMVKCHLECRDAWRRLAHEEGGESYVDFGEFSRGCLCEHDRCECERRYKS